MWDTDRNLEGGLFAEGVMRNVLKKYEAKEFIDSYNHYVQSVVMTYIDIEI